LLLSNGTELSTGLKTQKLKTCTFRIDNMLKALRAPEMKPSEGE
jgi:hypothetical protein